MREMHERFVAPKDAVPVVLDGHRNRAKVA
jgi:hypothetical protein